MSSFIDSDFSKLVDASFLRTFLDAVSDGVLVRDPTGRIVAFNEPALRLMGATAGQLRGTEPRDPTWRAVLQDGSAVTAENNPGTVALRTGEAIRAVVVRVHLPDGTLHWLSGAASPLRGRDGTVVGAITSYQDLTESRRITDLLQVHEARAEALAEEVEQGTFEWDLVNDHMARSRHAYAMFGYRPGEVGTRGADWHALVHEADRPAVLAQWEEVRAGTHAKFDLEYRKRHREGRFLWVRAQARVIRRDRQGRGQRVAGTVQDVTGRREAQEALRREKARVQALEAELARRG
jgi:PAS domain S-box-containing protein